MSMSVASLTAETVAYDSPLSLGGVIIIVIISCVLGIVWAFFNYLGVKKIDLKAGQQGEYEGLAEASDAQIKLLLELGEKISEVRTLYNVGCQGIPQAGIPGLHHLHRCHVLHHLWCCGVLPHCLHRFCLPHRSHYIHLLRCHRNDDCYLHQLQSHLLRQERTRRCF